jgi:hypothetical protein
MHRARFPPAEASAGFDEYDGINRSTASMIRSIADGTEESPMLNPFRSIPVYLE